LCYEARVALSTWLGFFAACWLISLSPGPGAVTCMSTGVRHPYRRAVWTVLGIVAGIQTLVAVVAVGVGALVAASGAVLGAVRWLGVAYLVYLGVQQWRAAPAGTVAARAGEPERETRLALFLRGYLVNVTNPKGIVFLLAVLPQFVDPARPAAPQYALCGASLAATDLVVMSGYAVVARSVLRWYGSPSHLRWLNRLFGTLFVAAGLGLAVWRRG
jgi:homoserine/homoserine lactone efflux protein